MEALAIEVAPLGLEATLLEPGGVSSGALDDVTRYDLPGDPYPALSLGPDRGGDTRALMVTPEEVAAGVADAAESPRLPLRIPLGDPARMILGARRSAPDTVPFRLGQPAEPAGASA